MLLRRLLTIGGARFNRRRLVNDLVSPYGSVVCVYLDERNQVRDVVNGLSVFRLAIL
jgi:hypothetical protein